VVSAVPHVAVTVRASAAFVARLGLSPVELGRAEIGRVGLTLAIVPKTGTESVMLLGFDG